MFTCISPITQRRYSFFKGFYKSFSYLVGEFFGVTVFVKHVFLDIGELQAYAFNIALDLFNSPFLAVLVNSFGKTFSAVIVTAMPIVPSYTPYIVKVRAKVRKGDRAMNGDRRQQPICKTM